jgi:hypothetical protein
MKRGNLLIIVSSNQTLCTFMCIVDSPVTSHQLHGQPLAQAVRKDGSDKHGGSHGNRETATSFVEQKGGLPSFS